MANDPTAFWSAVGAVASAVFAAGAFIVAWHARSIQGASVDFTACLDVIERLRVAQDRVRRAEGDAEYDFEFHELLNLLEVLALLHNDGRLAKSTKKIVGNFLDQALGWIRNDQNMEARMNSAMTSDQTFEALRKFEKRRRKEVAKLARKYAIETGNR